MTKKVLKQLEAGDANGVAKEIQNDLQGLVYTLEKGQIEFKEFVNVLQNVANYGREALIVLKN